MIFQIHQPDGHAWNGMPIAMGMGGMVCSNAMGMGGMVRSNPMGMGGMVRSNPMGMVGNAVFPQPGGHGLA